MLSEAFYPPLGPGKLGVVFNRTTAPCSNSGWQVEGNLPFSSPHFLNWTDTGQHGSVLDTEPRSWVSFPHAP